MVQRLTRTLGFSLLMVAVGGASLSGAHAEDRMTASLNPGHVDERGDRTIIPGYRIGPIKADTSEAQLIQMFGANSMVRSRHYLGTEKYEEVTRLFAGGWATVQIHWADNFRKIRHVIITGKYAPWRTRQGITIGTTLAELQKLNGKPFLISGFSHHFGGRVISWNNGKLSETVKVRLAPARKVSDLQLWEVMGDQAVSSRHWVFRNMDLRVESLFVMLQEDKSSALNREPQKDAKSTSPSAALSLSRVKPAAGRP